MKFKLFFYASLLFTLANANEICKLSNTPYGQLIRQHESGNNYNIYNFYKVNSSGKEYLSKSSANFSDMTIAQVVQNQKENKMFAVGAYQIVNYNKAPVLDEAISYLGISPLDNFTKELQDKIFDDYLTKSKRSAIYDYFYGNGSLENGALDTAREWASMPVKKGTRIAGNLISKSNCYVSYYASNGIDGSHICYETLINAMKVSKEQLLSNACNPTKDINKDEEAVKKDKEEGNYQGETGGFTEINSGAGGGGACGGCRDWGIGARLGNQTLNKFEALDKETISEIQKIIDKIYKAHRELEVSSKNILIQNQKLLELQAEIEQKRIFNAEIINMLQNVINTKGAEK